MNFQEISQLLSSYGFNGMYTMVADEQFEKLLNKAKELGGEQLYVWLRSHIASVASRHYLSQSWAQLEQEWNFFVEENKP